MLRFGSRGYRPYLFHYLEARTFDHFDDLVLGHFYFARRGVAVDEFAALSVTRFL